MIAAAAPLRGILLTCTNDPTVTNCCCRSSEMTYMSRLHELTPARNRPVRPVPVGRNPDLRTRWERNALDGTAGGHGPFNPAV